MENVYNLIEQLFILTKNVSYNAIIIEFRGYEEKLVSNMQMIFALGSLYIYISLFIP